MRRDVSEDKGKRCMTLLMLVLVNKSSVLVGVSSKTFRYGTRMRGAEADRTSRVHMEV